MEELNIIIELNIKTQKQSKAVAGVIYTLTAIDCLDEESATTLTAITEDAPFLL